MARLLTILLALLAVTVILACGAKGAPSSTETPQQQAGDQSLTRVNTGNNVAMEAVWITQADLASLPQELLKDYPSAQYVLIHVKLDTHSVDLSKYEMARLSTLKGRAASTIAAAAWLDISNSGHHRDGVLVFPGMSNSQWETQEGSTVLTVKDIAGVAERTFQWQF